MMKRSAFVFIMILLSLHPFYAQDQKDLERLSGFEPLRTYYDSLLSINGIFVSRLNHGQVNDVFLHGPSVNREFSTPITDTALINSINQSGIGYDRFLRLLKMMEHSGALTLRSTGRPGNSYYTIEIGYSHSPLSGACKAYLFTFGQAATKEVVNNTHYKLVKPGVYTFSYKTH